MNLLGDPANPAILFLHGFLGRGSDWQPVAQQLSIDYFCILPDLPGHGHDAVWSENQPYSYASMSGYLISLLDSININQAVWVGYSMGGRIALYAALHYPERVRALALESTSPGIADETARLIRAEQDSQRAADLRANGLPAFLEAWYEMPLFHSLKNYPLLLKKLKENKSDHSAENIARVIEQMSPGCQPYLGAYLGELRLPVLLLAGALDTQYANQQAHFAEQIQGVRALQIPFAGHNIHAERQERFVAVLKAFLK